MIKNLQYFGELSLVVYQMLSLSITPKCVWYILAITSRPNLPIGIFGQTMLFANSSGFIPWSARKSLPTSWIQYMCPMTHPTRWLYTSKWLWIFLWWAIMCTVICKTGTRCVHCENKNPFFNFYENMMYILVTSYTASAMTWDLSELTWCVIIPFYMIKLPERRKLIKIKIHFTLYGCKFFHFIILSAKGDASLLENRTTQSLYSLLTCSLLLVS